MRPNQSQVIQGNFVGGHPTFAVQAKSHFGNAAERPTAPHVQAALQQNIPSSQTAQRQTASFAKSAIQRQPASHVQTALSQHAPHPQTAQRQTTQPGGAPTPIVQRMGTGTAMQVPPGQLMLRPGHLGKPLPEAVQRKMETAFSADFSDVRVHVGPEPSSIGALAFTMGSNLYFAPGQYNPNTSHGQQLIGHELAHVVQQRSGRVRNPFGQGMAVVQDPGLEAEAERMGLKMVQAQPKPAARRAPQLTKSMALHSKDAGSQVLQPAMYYVGGGYDKIVKRTIALLKKLQGQTLYSSVATFKTKVQGDTVLHLMGHGSTTEVGRYTKMHQLANFLINSLDIKNKNIHTVELHTCDGASHCQNLANMMHQLCSDRQFTVRGVDGYRFMDDWGGTWVLKDNPRSDVDEDAFSTELDAFRVKNPSAATKSSMTSEEKAVWEKHLKPATIIEKKSSSATK